MPVVHCAGRGVSLPMPPADLAVGPRDAPFAEGEVCPAGEEVCSEFFCFFFLRVMGNSCVSAPSV